jgi:hypothetical protein
MTYDSTEDTKAHINRVQVHIAHMQAALDERAALHDRSKLEEPEKSMFDTYTPRLRALTYGSAEYEACRQAMLVAGLQHHYEHNSHHPEHAADCFDGMSLLDLLEMFADWRAATERHADGSMAQSLEVNRTRDGWNMSPQLYNILVNTARELGWL